MRKYKNDYVFYIILYLFRNDSQNEASKIYYKKLNHKYQYIEP